MTEVAVAQLALQRAARDPLVFCQGSRVLLGTHRSCANSLNFSSSGWKSGAGQRVAGFDILRPPWLSIKKV